MKRIALGGMRHETNTFAPSKADYAAFSSAGAEPSPLEGHALLHTLQGANIALQGAIDTLRAQGHTLLPLVWASATPSAHVTEDAFERIVGRLLQLLAEAGPLDGVYLDLHGAMVTEHLDDGEGEILRRVRACIGPDVPLVASLDSHANVTRQMVEHADALCIFRTYPHVDMAATGARAASLLLHMLSSGRRLHKAYRSFDYLVPLTAQCTLIEPAQGLYQQLRQLQAQSGVSLDFATGFPLADLAECGMSLVAYGDDAQATQAALQTMGEAIANAERAFDSPLLSPDEAITRAMAIGRPGAPVVLADTQDNPGIGGNGDTTGMLEALLRLRPPNAVLGLLTDPASAAQAHALGLGARAEFSLGAISGLPGHHPVKARFEVEQLGDGQLTCSGPMFGGLALKLGPMACLRDIDSGVRVVLSSRKFQGADQALFRHVGIEPIEQALLVLKSSVHFRADFQPLAQAVWVVKAPGPATEDPTELPWRKLRHGVRLSPLGPTHPIGSA